MENEPQRSHYIKINSTSKTTFTSGETPFTRATPITRIAPIIPRAIDLECSVCKKLVTTLRKGTLRFNSFEDTDSHTLLFQSIVIGEYVYAVCNDPACK